MRLLSDSPRLLYHLAKLTFLGALSELMLDHLCGKTLRQKVLK